MPKTVKGIINHPVTPPLLIFLSAFGLRLALIITTRDFPLFQIPIMDMLYHDEWARRIAGGDFWGNEVFFRAPLYPYFLAALYAISGGSITFARVVQAVIGGGSTVACYFVGLELFKNRKIAFTGAALLATIWTAVYFDVELLLVVLEVFFDLLAVLFLLKARGGRVRNFILAGLFVGMSAITRPNILSFALFVWLIYLVARPRLDKKKLIKGLITFYIAVIIVI
ncbi:MAG: glycosyltransferase family 39 protein, partial [Candidatus Coatesbacteria bacterium]